MVCPPCILAGMSLVSTGTGVSSKSNDTFVFFMLLALLFFVLYLWNSTKDCKKCKDK